MAGRVLATEKALDAIKRMKDVIGGPMMDDIDRVNKEGQFLCQPNEWDGPRAEQFRSDWPEMNHAMVKAKDAVEQLRKQADQITKAIMDAGGFAA